MTFNPVQLGRAVTFMKYLASVIFLIFLRKSLVLKKNHISTIKFTESCRAGGKWASVEHLKKIY